MLFVDYLLVLHNSPKYKSFIFKKNPKPLQNNLNLAKPLQVITNSNHSKLMPKESKFGLLSNFTLQSTKEPQNHDKYVVLFYLILILVHN